MISILIDEFLQHGHVMALESEALGERHFLDAQIMPSGEAYVRQLMAGKCEGDEF